jgi:2-polyprenyl-3-methyl-5-hydroxy-6-metoxy-1,4-benzoquinol methylase
VITTQYFEACPVCGASDWKFVNTVQDHSISKENFSLFECASCTVQLTVGAPSKENIGRYYKSSDYISHTNTREGLLNKLYQWVRTWMLYQKRKLIETQLKRSSGTLLDYGSGTGAFVAHMQQAGWEVTGIEPDGDARKVAQKDFGVELLQESALSTLSPSQFDVITLWHVLEHVHDLQATMASLRRLLKPTGLLVIAVPNYTSADAQYFGPQWAAYDVPRHLYHFSPTAMKICMQKNQLQVKSIYPLWFDSYYVSLLSTRYVLGKTNYVQGFWQGLRSTVATLRDQSRCSSLIYLITQ